MKLFSSLTGVLMCTMLSAAGLKANASDTDSLLNASNRNKPVHVESRSKAVSRNNNFLKIYPDVVRRQLHIRTRNNAGLQLNMMVVDKEGQVVKQFELKAKEHAVIDDLATGKYAYYLFSETVEIGHGQFEIR